MNVQLLNKIMKKQILFVLLLISHFCQSQTTIFDVARTGTVQEMKALLVSNPLDINKSTPEGFTPLILACYRGNNEVAIFLIESGAALHTNWLLNP